MASSFALVGVAQAASNGGILAAPVNVVLPGKSESLSGAVRGIAVSSQVARAFVSVSTEAGSSIQILDLSGPAATIVDQVTMDIPAGPIAVAPNGKTVYVLGMEAGRRTVIVVDVGGVHPRVMAKHDLGAPFKDFALSADGSMAYLASDLGFHQAIQAFRLPDFTPTAFPVKVSTDIQRLKLSPDGSQLAGVGGYDNALVVMAINDGGSDKREWRGSGGASLGAFAFSADGKSIFQSTGNDHGVVVINRDLGSGDVVTRSKVIPLSVAQDLAVSPDGRHVYVAGATENLVAVLSTQTLAIEQMLHTPSSAPAALAVSARRDGSSTLYVAQGGDPTEDNSRPMISAYAQVDPGSPVKVLSSASQASGRAKSVMGCAFLMVLGGVGWLAVRRRG